MSLSLTVFGQGRPLVLLPGFALDAAVMAAAFEPVFTGAAGDLDLQRIYLDLPGTGRSAGAEPTSEAVLAAVQETVGELLGDTPYLLAGHSYGGYLAAGLARRNPARVAGLLLLCAGSRIRPADRDLTGVLPSSPEAGWLDGVDADLHEHFAHGLGDQTRASADRVADAFRRRGPIDEDYLAALRPDGYRLDDEVAQTAFTGPVCVLAGRRDRIAGYRDPFAALTRYPNGNYALLAAAGHYLPFELPETLATHTRAWLASAPEASPS
jgi:pimeloyl-ACP methyl ester carboxylesterase